MFFKKLKKILLSVIIVSIVFFNTMPTFCFYSYYDSKNDISSSITVTGDSYAGWFATYEAFRDYDIILYAEPGKSTAENMHVMEEAINSPSKYILISIGVNDHFRNEPVELFRQRICYLVESCALKGKKVFLHTYMPYIPANTDYNFAHYLSDYDRILKDIAKTYNNVHYIDMSDYNNLYYLQPDRIHYGKKFYDALYDRLNMAMFLYK